MANILSIFTSVMVGTTLIVYIIALVVPAWFRSRVESSSGLEIWTNLGPVFSKGCIKSSGYDTSACDTTNTNAVIWFMYLYTGPLNERTESCMLRLNALMSFTILSALCANVLYFVVVRCRGGGNKFLVFCLASIGISGILSFIAATTAISDYKTLYYEPEYTIQKDLLFDANIMFLFPWSTIVAYIGTFLAITSVVLLTKEVIGQPDRDSRDLDNRDQLSDTNSMNQTNPARSGNCGGDRYGDLAENTKQPYDTHM